MSINIDYMRFINRLEDGILAIEKVEKEEGRLIERMAGRRDVLVSLYIRGE
jgi:hypothetical protein